jgi:hypothetical protein
VILKDVGRDVSVTADVLLSSSGDLADAARLPQTSLDGFLVEVATRAR